MIVLAFFFSCEENKDGFYDNIARIYFPEETDSLSFSFGDKIAEYTRHVVNVPVKMMGINATEEMRFKVVLNTELSTAEEGVHFVELQSEYPLLVDSVNAYIPVELIRDELSEDDQAVVDKAAKELQDAYDALQLKSDNNNSGNTGGDNNSGNSGNNSNGGNVSSGSDAPKTGDAADFAPWAVCLVLAAGASVVTLKTKKKN